MTSQKIIISIFVLVIVGILGVVLYIKNTDTHLTASPSPKVSTEETQTNNLRGDISATDVFTGGKLTTDNSLHSIPLDKVLSGGPGKDGIPALLFPSFVSVGEAQGWLPSDADGIVVSIGNTTRFYPYNILVWHEIANDMIEDTPVIVTFCPLCGSAIVFDARIDNTQEYFGVSGSLYESNLLMYDVTTQSLWSQILGEAVVGAHTGKKLTIIPSQVISFSTLTAQYPDAQVMSKETGYSRNYTRGPYGDYNNNDSLYFPISIEDTRLPTKEVMYIVNYKDKSIAFQRNELSSDTTATVAVGDQTLSAQIINGEIQVTDTTGASIPGYTAMWFSWAIHHQENGIVWKK